MLTSGVNNIRSLAVLHIYDEDIMHMKACRRVLSGNGADWKKPSFYVRSRWRPELSIVFWLSFYLGREPLQWTGRHLDATDIPPAIAAVRQPIQLFHGTSKVVASSEMERLLRIVDTNLKRAVEFIYSTACVQSLDDTFRCSGFHHQSLHPESCRACVGRGCGN